jgi:predicted molibdopterin-dependent oxidoreductase YjgC
MAHRLTTCTFCGVGCGLYLETTGNRVVGVSPSMSHPANEGRICVRGWHVHEIIDAPDRLKRPLLRKNGVLQEASWDEAFDFIVTRLKEIRDRHGSDSIAFLNSPRCSNEESYLLQKLARAVFKTNNVDHGAGVYSNYSLNVLLKMLGVPAATNSIRELGRSDVIIVDGVDLGRQLPTIGGAVIRAKLKGAKLIVVDTRRHRVAENADIFLQHRPGTETLLYGAMAKVIVDHGLMDLPFIKARCRAYESFLAAVDGYDLLAIAGICGVPAEQIESAALSYARAGSAAILYSTGIEAGDAESIEAMVNLCLLCGQLGREGSGIFSLTEHNNLQGVCDMGMLPDRLPGYGAVSNDAARREIESIWNARLPAGRGMTAKWALSHRGNGIVRAVWLCRYDPVSTAFISEAARSLEKCDLVVMQHLFLTPTAKYAHVVLPTTVFGEERVTFTSTERRIQLAEKVIEPPGDIEPAWRQLTRVAQAMGAEWKYDSPADVMDEIGRVVPFYSGANYDNLGRDYGRQWPCTREHPMGTQFLFAPGHPLQTFTFVPIEKGPQPVITSEEYPFTLVFGHSLYYWHQNVLIRHSETLRREYRMLLLDYPEGFVEINTDDATRFNIRDGEKIRLRTTRGTSTTAARVTREVLSGTVYVPYFVSQVMQQLQGVPEKGVQLLPVRVERDAP